MSLSNNTQFRGICASPAMMNVSTQVESIGSRSQSMFEPATSASISTLGIVQS